MKKIVSWVLLVAMLMTSLVAVAEGATDEFDVSADAAKVSELGIPTVSSVAELKSNADSLWNAGDYQAAADAYSFYAKNANWLANLIAAGCEPYYGRSNDEQSDFYRTTSDGFYYTVSAGESKSNSYKSERNRAMAYEALCYYKLGDYVTAVPLLTKALDLIEIDEVEYWELCTNALYDIVGLKESSESLKASAWLEILAELLAAEFGWDIDTSSIENFCLSASEFFGHEVSAASVEELMDSCENGYEFAEKFLMMYE